jgi:hypothetical protein
MAVFWVVAPCSLLEVYRRFCQTTRRYNPEDSLLRTHRRENLKSYSSVLLKLECVVIVTFSITYGTSSGISTFSSWLLASRLQKGKTCGSCDVTGRNRCYKDTYLTVIYFVCAVVERNIDRFLCCILIAVPESMLCIWLLGIFGSPYLFITKTFVSPLLTFFSNERNCYILTDSQ